MSYSAPRPLHADDPVEHFASGEPELDTWLARRALANQVSGASRTFVTTDGDGAIAGYYCLSTGAVSHSDVAGKVRRNQPQQIPVILLGRLAVDGKDQGRGLGKHLLRDAILRTVRVSDDIGVRALLVHALHDEARRFYERFGLESSPTDPLHLLLLMQDARTLLADG